MKRLNKLLIAAAAVIAGIAIGILLVSRSGGENISEEEVSAMITDRYGGKSKIYHRQRTSNPI